MYLADHMEYANSSIGDGGFILKLGDDLASNASWKAKCYFFGPMEGQDPVVKHIPIPEDWMAVDFDDLNWESATVYEAATVRPPRVFSEYDFEGAEFIWTSDLELHNTIVFRTTIDKPGWKPRWNTGTPARRANVFKPYASFLLLILSRRIRRFFGCLVGDLQQVDLLQIELRRAPSIFC